MFLLFNFLLLIVGLLSIVSGLVILQQEASYALIVLLLGGASLCAAFFLDRLRVSQNDARVTTEIEERTKELTQRAWQPHERLEVPSSLLIPLFLLGLVLGSGWMLYVGLDPTDRSWPLALGGLFFLALAGLMLPYHVSELGKPALILDYRGLTTAVDGTVPWSAVDGIYLQEIKNRGIRNWTLFFHIPHFARVVKKIHWSQRWLAFFGLGALRLRRVGVPLRSGREHPETIEAVARHLWVSATGKNHFWSPHVSPQANQAFSRLTTLQQTLDQEFLNAPEQALVCAKQAGRDLAIIRKDWKQKTRLINWLAGLSLAAILLSFVWSWLETGWHW